MALIKGVHHIALKCTGQAAFADTLRFYNETLEMPIVRTWATGAMLDTGCGIMEIFSDGESILPQGAIRHFALASDDVDACIEKVRAAGCQVTKEPTDIVIPSEPPMPARIAFCIGPVGEEIEFFCQH